MNRDGNGKNYVNKSTKKNLIGVCVGILLMFAWVFVTVYLTGERELEDFSKQDWIVFSCFLLIEVITVAVTFVFADKTGKENTKALNELKSDQSRVHSMNNLPTSQGKRERRRGIIMLLAAWILSLIFIILGIIFQKYLTGDLDFTLKILFTVSCVFPVLLLPLNILMKKKYIAKWKTMKVSELQEYLLSHRKESLTTSTYKMKVIERLQLLSDVYAGVLCLFAIIIALYAGILSSTDLSTPLGFYSGILFLTSISRIRFPRKMSYLQEDESFVEVDDYPELYRLANEAQKVMNCSGHIRISLTADCNAGIAKIGDSYTVQLGAILLNTLSQEELYAILLHEFSHVILDDSQINRQSKYNNLISSGGNTHFFSGLSSILFCYLDTVYSFQYSMYLYSISVITEEKADLAMAELGDKNVAASALLKLKYYELFEWEDEAADSESLYLFEEPMQDILQQRFNRFLKKMPERSDEWNNLAKVEIISRTASHPTLRMRLDAIGVNDYHVLETTNNINYTNDVRKAIKHVDEMLSESRLASYSEDRENFYLKPKEIIENWERRGKPIVSTDYRDIDASMRQLGRMTESKNLCDRAISELPESATHYASFIKGVFLIHKFDPSGLNFIYEAMEYNSNYIDEGIEQIGNFCCLTGRQTELDQYRKKSVELIQKQKDEYSQISILKKNDNLSSEHLPSDILDGVLSYIGSIDGGFVQKVYIVRKTISEVLFTSALVVRFVDNTDEELITDFFHKMFNYLDTCGSWQFSLFDYSEVSKIKFDSIPNSCIYEKQ